MKYNKESTLAQLQIIDDNLRRLRTLVEADMVGIAGDINVEMYCCIRMQLQADQIGNELRSAFGFSQASKEITDLK